MKILVSDYTFDASAKTITFNAYGSIVLANILLITNVTDNIIIYSFADATKGGTVATNVLTLTYDTTSMADADKLMIYYEDGNNFNLTKITDSTDNLDLVKQTDAITDATVGILLHGRTSANQALALPISTAGSATLGSVSIWDNGGSITVDAGASSLPINDNAGSLTVDLAGGTDALVGRVKITDGTDVALVNASGRLLVEAISTEGDPILQIEGASNVNGYTAPVIFGIQDVGGTDIARVLRMDASGNALVSASLSATDNAVLDAIEADTTTLAGAVAGSEIQVDVVAALPAGSNNIGSVTSELATPGNKTIRHAVISHASSASDFDVVTPGAGERIRVMSYSLVCSAAVTVQFVSDTGGANTALTGVMSFVANGGISDSGGGFPIFETATNGHVLQMVLGGNVQVSGRLSYYIF